MKKLFLVLMAASMLMTVACKNQSGKTASNDSSAAAGSGAVMKFEKDSHDFGKIKAGAKITYDYKFTNTGKSPLIITDAKASCGCTIPVWPKEPIKPGESSHIKVTFDSAGKVGLQDKQILVTANTIPAQNIVHLIGEVTF